MIFGIGCDIVNVERIKKEEHFIKRVFSQKEFEVYKNRNFANEQQKVLYIAKRFAAKEAIAKAIGTGFRDGLHLSDIEIFNDELGKPFALLSDNAQKLVASHISSSDFRIFLSLSDDAPFAQAMAIIEIH